MTHGEVLQFTAFLRIGLILIELNNTKLRSHCLSLKRNLNVCKIFTTPRKCI